MLGEKSNEATVGSVGRHCCSFGGREERATQCCRNSRGYTKTTPCVRAADLYEITRGGPTVVSSMGCYGDYMVSEKPAETRGVPER